MLIKENSNKASLTLRPLSTDVIAFQYQVVLLVALRPLLIVIASLIFVKKKGRVKDSQLDLRITNKVIFDKKI